MFADQARISKLGTQYNHTDPNAYSDSFSFKQTTQTGNGYYRSIALTNGAIYDLLDNSNGNVSFSYIWWGKLVFNSSYYRNYRQYFTPIIYSASNTTGTPGLNCAFVVRHHAGSDTSNLYNQGPTVRAFPRPASNSTVTNSCNLYSWGSANLSNKQKKLSDWTFIAVSLYKNAPSDSIIRSDWYIDGEFKTTHSTNTSSGFGLGHNGNYDNVFFAHRGTVYSLYHNYSVSKSCLYASNNGSKLTQADVDAHYNNGLHIDWSNISMSSGHTRLTYYEFGDDPNDTSTNIQDLSGNGFHLNAKSGDGEIVQDAP